MNNKVNYTLVGLLVIFGISLMLGFSYWLLKPTAEDETKKYLIHFDESVLGLNLDAPVKYRGISVGKVSKIRINPKDSQQVEVLVTILKTTPIKLTTIAKLTSHGITGISYINLSLGGNNAPILKAKDGDEYPIIKTEPSFFERFDKSFDSVSEKLLKTLSKTEKLLNDDNQEQIASILKKTASFMDGVQKLVDDKTINHFQSSMKNIDSTTKKIDMMMPRFNTLVDKSIVWEDKVAMSLASIKNSYLGIKCSMDEIRRAVASGEFNVKKISGDILPSINNTMFEMQQLMIDTEVILRRYNRSPNDILFKSEEIKKGPGEK